MLRSICATLDLERSGVNCKLVKRILNFLMHPKPSGKPLPKSKKTLQAKIVNRNGTVLEQQESQSKPNALKFCQMNPVVTKMRRKIRKSLQKMKRKKMKRSTQPKKTAKKEKAKWKLLLKVTNL